MASDAQKLISLSLTKIAQSRSQRKGLSLHKNLLVATVLQKARYIFMEEAYNMIHGPLSHPSDLTSEPESVDTSDNKSAFNDEVDLIALSEEENNNCSNDESSSSNSCSSNDNVPRSNSDIFNIPSVTNNSSSNCTSSSLNFSENFNSSSQCTTEDKENLEPTTYLDLDKDTDNIILKERSTSPTKSSNLKRKRIIAEWETEEAVLSILPKKHKSTTEIDDSVFLDDSTLLSPTSSDEESDEGAAMEIDRITSLVSIFSFGGLGGPTSESNKLTRSSSTPDLCSAQAKDQHDLQQRQHFLAMTV